jgi:hypothetical protein
MSNHLANQLIEMRYLVELALPPAIFLTVLALFAGARALNRKLRGA